MYATLRPLLFRLEAETAHDAVLGALAQASRSRAATALLERFNRRRIAALPVEVMGIRFPHPVGLAAGLDKRGNACNALHALGFGFLELGTVTPLPQPGNPRPRLFRVKGHGALINRMGFNSDGLERFCRHVARCDARIIKGVNIGKNAATALSAAAHDYLACLDAVHRHADYVAVNLSSPNTRGLRELQRADALDPLLGGLDRRRMQLADAGGRRVPLVLKISPDADRATLDDIASLARKHRIDGIAATNTTRSRANIEGHAPAAEPGGLSGPPLAEAATETVAALFGNLQGEIPIIGIGGIDSAERALEKFQAGADLVQIYTGFVYRGPRLIREITERLRLEAGARPMRDFLDELRAGRDR